MLKVYIKGKLVETLRVVSSVISKCKKSAVNICRWCSIVETVGCQRWRNMAIMAQESDVYVIYTVGGIKWQKKKSKDLN